MLGLCLLCEDASSTGRWEQSKQSFWWFVWGMAETLLQGVETVQHQGWWTTGPDLQHPAEITLGSLGKFPLARPWWQPREGLARGMLCPRRCADYSPVKEGQWDISWNSTELRAWTWGGGMSGAVLGGAVQQDSLEGSCWSSWFLTAAETFLVPAQNCVHSVSVCRAVCECAGHCWELWMYWRCGNVQSCCWWWHQRAPGEGLKNKLMKQNHRL